MAGRRNEYALKFVLQLFILSQKQILGVKNVVCVFKGGSVCFHELSISNECQNTEKECGLLSRMRGPQAVARYIDGRTSITVP